MINLQCDGKVTRGELLKETEKGWYLRSSYMVYADGGVVIRSSTRGLLFPKDVWGEMK